MGDDAGSSVSRAGLGRRAGGVATDTIGDGYFVAALAEFSATDGFTDLDGTDPGTGSGTDSEPPRFDDADLDHEVSVIADRQVEPWGTGGEPVEIEVSVYGNTEVRVRDQLPADWRFIGGDVHTTDTDGDTRYVTFQQPLEHGTRTYYVDPPADRSAATTPAFGPIEYRLCDGSERRSAAQQMDCAADEHWIELSDTTDRNHGLDATSTSYSSRIDYLESGGQSAPSGRWSR